MTPTPEQLRAIRTHDRSLLVSAAAGSGKTAVLAQRCAEIICRSQAPCGVENLLVVTFTKAAAQQMRERITRQLRIELECADAGSDDSAARRLRREIELLPRAAISTLSSFCAGILRRHFHAAGVDPQFVVLDEDQARLLRRQVARAVLDEHYEKDDPDFIALVDYYAEGYDDRLIGAIIACHELQTSLADPAAWRRRAVEQVREAAEGPLLESALGEALLELIRQETTDLAAAADDLLARAHELGIDKYAEHIQQRLLGPAREWVEHAAAGDLDALSAAVRRYADESGRLPPLRAHEKPPGQGELHEDINTWKRQARSGPPAVLMRFTPAEWKLGMQRILPPIEAFLALVAGFGTNYEREKSRRRALDFADLERRTLDLLLQDPARPDRLEPSPIALHYQRQFHHVLVDEFQDINEVQDRLLRLLSRETAPPESRAAWRDNLFVVGDVKQSIYRFRLAEPAMFLQRADANRPLDEAHGGVPARLDLQTNFRSRAPLLLAVNDVFSRLMTDRKLLDIDYGQKHALAANPQYPAPVENGFSGGPVEIHVLDPQGMEAPNDPEESDPEESQPDDENEARDAERIEREAAVVARRIHDFIREGRLVLAENGQLEPFTFRHAAVLLRSRKHNSERFAGVLRRMEIPCFSEVGTGFFHSLEVRDLLSLLHVLDNQRQDVPLAAVLRSPLVDLPDAEDVLARIRLLYRDGPFFEAVFRYARFQDDAISARLRHVLDQLETWRRLAHRRPLAELLWQVYLETGYLGYVAGLHDGEQRVANLLELHRRAGQFDAFQRSGLCAFMEFLQSLEEAGEVGQPPILSEADNVVRVMSIHASKGLEFPVVFLPDCGKDHNLTDATKLILFDRQMHLAMPAVDPVRQLRYYSLVHELAKRHIRRSNLAEELRVLYVAMTRAREHLVCVGTARGRSAQERVARWTRDAANHALPVATVLKGRSYLEWLCRASAGSPHFDLRIVTADEIDAAARRVSGRAKIPPVETRFRDLQPIHPAPAADPIAQEIVQRLTTPYAHAAVTRLQASAGVTSLEKHEALPTRPGGHFRGVGSLKAPEWLAPADTPATPAAADVGTATHLALRLLDFRDAADESAVRRQLEDMVARRQLSAPMARHVDADSLAWLAGTELGAMFREHHDRLLRELPVRVPADPGDLVPGWDSPAGDPLDRILLRGQVDAVLPLDSGLVVADYKTDRLADEHTESDVNALAERYRPQLGHYHRALQQITGRPVSLSYLVLLHPRRLIRL